MRASSTWRTGRWLRRLRTYIGTKHTYRRCSHCDVGANDSRSIKPPRVQGPKRRTTPRRSPISTRQQLPRPGLSRRPGGQASGQFNVQPAQQELGSLAILPAWSLKQPVARPRPPSKTRPFWADAARWPAVVVASAHAPEAEVYAQLEACTVVCARLPQYEQT